MTRPVQNQHMHLSGAAIIASLGVYFPVPLLRGAIFGLFPGIACQSRKMCLTGALLGIVFELIYIVVWSILISDALLGMHWDRRLTYNVFLCEWLPGQFPSATHCGGAVPCWLQFVLNMVVWFCWMVVVWWILWRPRLVLRRLEMLLVRTSLVVFTGAGILWALSSLNYGLCGFGDHYSGSFALDDKVWVIVFLGTFPLCGILISRMFAKKVMDRFQSKTGHEGEMQEDRRQ